MITSRGGLLGGSIEQDRGRLVGLDGAPGDVVAPLDWVDARLREPCVQISALARQEELVGSRAEQWMRKQHALAVQLDETGGECRLQLVVFHSDSLEEVRRRTQRRSSESKCATNARIEGTKTPLERGRQRRRHVRVSVG